MGCTVDFRAILGESPAIYNLGLELNCVCHSFLLALMWSYASRAKKRVNLFYRLFMYLSVIYYGPWAWTQVWKHLQTIATYIEVIKCLSSAKDVRFILRSTGVILARAFNTDVWQAIVARATESRKNCSKVTLTPWGPGRMTSTE